LILSGRSNPQPIITSDLTVASITLSDNANLQISSGVTVTINNYISSNVASINNTISGLGTVLFTTSSSGISGASPITISNLKINSSTDVPLNADVTVSSSLTFISGKFVLSNNNLTIANSASITGAGTNSFIKTSTNPSEVGSLIRNVSSSTVIFPVGNINYTPVSLSNNGTATNFNIRCIENVLQDGNTGSPLSITGKLNKSWIITPASNSGLNVNATFNWYASNECSSFNRNQSTVVKNENNGSLTWYKTSITGAASGSDPYSYSANNITSFSTFSIFSDLSIVPVEFLSFTGELIGKNALLKWTTGTELNNKGFYVEKSENGIDFVRIAFVNALNNNSSYHQYQFTDILKTSKIYYRLQQIDKDGKTSFSNIVIINNNRSIQIVQITPNPFKNNIELIAGSDLNTNQDISIKVFNSMGLVIKTFKGNFENVKREIRTILANKTSGMYFFNIETSDLKQHIKLVKE